MVDSAQNIFHLAACEYSQLTTDRCSCKSCCLNSMEDVLVERTTNCSRLFHIFISIKKLLVVQKNTKGINY